MTADPFIDILGEWMEISRRHSMRSILRYARASGLSMSHLSAILHTQRIGSCGVTEIGEHLGVTSAAASQMLDRLVQQGLVLRSEDPDDRRAKRIVLTEKGQRILEEGIRARQSWLNEVSLAFTDEEKEIITSALKMLTERVRQLYYGSNEK
ncbi:MAG: MarR family transcriptional regulator [Anaerolineales bacterium]|jgi:DNA-binding MarR family transcriptional regulator